MNHKYCVVKMTNEFLHRKEIRLFTQNEFCECLARTEILFESDDYKEASDWMADFIFVFGEYSNI